MSRINDFSPNIKVEILLKYISTSEWSHRKLQKEVLGREAPARGGGFLVLEILRDFGILNSSLKGILSKVSSVDELQLVLNGNDVPQKTRDIILDAYFKRPQRKAYLLNWNPEKWSWDSFNEDFDSFQKQGTLIKKWGCGNRKNIKIGDRLFFIKLGKELPRGIMGSGSAVKGSYLSSHWSGESGKKGYAIDIEFDAIFDPSNESSFFLDYDTLISDDLLKTRDWSIQASGTQIEEIHLSRLEELWFSSFIQSITKQFKISSDDNLISEGRKIQSISRRYERNPKARQLCLSIHGYNCKACGLSFEEKYGALGKTFIHVHHTTPISSIGEEYQLDPVKDLIPLCPNCHAMIHRLPPPHSLKDLLEILKKSNHN